MTRALLAPNYAESAKEIVLLVKLADDETAQRIVINRLEAAFAEGGLKAIDMVKEGLSI